MRRHPIYHRYVHLYFTPPKCSTDLSGIQVPLRGGDLRLKEQQSQQYHQNVKQRQCAAQYNEKRALKDQQRTKNQSGKSEYCSGMEMCEEDDADGELLVLTSIENN